MQKNLETVDKYAWWSILNHGGLLIAPARLGEFFVEDVDDLPRYVSDRLRKDLDLFNPQNSETFSNLLDTVLERVLGLTAVYWRKGNNVDVRWSQPLITGETLKPQRIWQEPQGGLLPVFTVSNITRLGIGKGRRAVSRVIEWLRHANQKIALLTNGYQWRLIHAGSDYDAWCEADTSLWFEEGKPSLQVVALRSLLSPTTLTPEKKQSLSPLLSAIEASRQGQAELSENLGERVRQAIELLIRETISKQGNLEIDHKSLYISATRFIMRCVFILFAESRNLLDLSDRIYYKSYSLQGLREQLDRFSGGKASETLRHRFSAYPRLLALFSLIYHGCNHDKLKIPQYGGGLFKHGDSQSSDPILRALALFEQPEDEQIPSDEVIYRILELLTRSQVKIRQGKRSIWVSAPVDFSDLSSEYIGILYEGLLDFELRQAEADNPMIFLNLGNQPVLPLSRLEEMDDKTLESLVENLKKEAKSAPISEDEGDSEDEDSEEVITEDNEEELAEETEITEENEEDLFQDDVIAQLRNRAYQWAIKAVKVGKLVNKPRSKKTDALAQYESDVNSLAKKLIARIILPGEWFLVRWGGTRKGSGTFYTRPQLAVPTVRRTLEPLVYGSPQPLTPSPKQGEGEQESISDTPPTPLSLDGRGVGGEGIKTPEEILNLKICDPACGSASFLVAGLRYLTEALWQSLFAHGWLIEDTQKQLIRVGIPKDAQPEWFVQVVEDFPLTAEKAEEISKAQLKRYIVENCIYGVDLNPLAVELGRLALWVETMDKTLAFSFLDHKIKCGNALVGCWFDRFQDYPVMAWEREGGDKNHTKFVHHFRETETKQGKVNQKGDLWTQALKDLRNGSVKSELKALLECLKLDTPYKIHDEALTVFERIHSQVTNPWEQEAVYQENIADSEAIKRLKFAFDTWCAVWFWEGDDLDFSPTPNKFYAPPEETRAIIENLAQKYQFFHWELEFPDVFSVNGSRESGVGSRENSATNDQRLTTNENSGFSAIIGNPPWETIQPNSMEFFSNIDPLYRTYGKQEAINKQGEYFTNNPQIEKDWLAYNAELKALANWTNNVGFPWGYEVEKRGHLGQQSNKFSLSKSAKETEYLHDLWHNRRIKNKGYADPNHPFILQGGGKPYTYKLFLELSLSLLSNDGILGLIVPSGIYTDKGSTTLRTEFLEFNNWQWLFGFENRDKIFNIDSRFKFCPVIVQKGGQTKSIKATFMQRSLSTWENAENYVLDYPQARVEKFSPKSKAILEIRSNRDLEVLTKIYNNSVLLGDETPQGWGIQYSQGDFNMTSDSKLFPPRPKWEANGYIADEYGHWLKGKWQDLRESGVGSRESDFDDILKRPEGVILSRDHSQFIYIDDVEDIALPLYQGVMVGQFNSCRGEWISGTGLNAKWNIFTENNRYFNPQFLISFNSVKQTEKSKFEIKVGFRDIARNTDQRTMIACLIPSFPCGNKVPTLSLDKKQYSASLQAILNSFVFDFIQRIKQGAASINYFVIEDLPLLKPEKINDLFLEILGMKLGMSMLIFSNKWLLLKKYQENWYQLWAITPYERLRLRSILDAVIAEIYSLEIEDFAWILKESDYPSAQVNDKTFARTLDPKGFWRVDKEKDPEMRHTVLSLVAFHKLKEIGLDNFLNLNNGEGWMLPDTLTLADYNLGHDDRAKQPQPVTSRFTIEEWDNVETPPNAPLNYRQRFYPWQLAKTPEASWLECERHADNLSKLLGETMTENQTQKDNSAPPAKSAKLPSDPNFEAPKDLFGNPLPVDLFGNIIDSNSQKKRR